MVALYSETARNRPLNAFRRAAPYMKSVLSTFAVLVHLISSGPSGGRGVGALVAVAVGAGWVGSDVGQGATEPTGDEVGEAVGANEGVGLADAVGALDGDMVGTTAGEPQPMAIPPKRTAAITRLVILVRAMVRVGEEVCTT